MAMETDRKCVALRLPGRPDDGELRRAAEQALGEGEDWGAVEIEVLPGRKGTLLLVHPAAGLYIREDALRFLTVRGTDY